MTRRAIVDIVRGAVLGSYGVTGVDAGPLERVLGRLGLREPGIRVRLDRGLEIDLHLTVAYGVPVAEVARQVDSAVRYGIRRALDREVRRLAVHVGGLRYQPASVPPTKDALSPRPKETPAADPVLAAPSDGVRDDGSPGGSEPRTTGATETVATSTTTPAGQEPVGDSGGGGAPAGDHIPLVTAGRRRRGHQANGRSPG